MFRAQASASAFAIVILILLPLSFRIFRAEPFWLWTGTANACDGPDTGGKHILSQRTQG